MRRSPRAGCWRWSRAASAGLVVTLSTTRLREDYLAIVTLGFAEVVRLVASNEIWLTRGTDGISGIPGPVEARRSARTSTPSISLIVLVALLVVFFLMRRIDRSPYGRALRAIREDAQVAQVAGKQVLRFKTAGLRAVRRHRRPRRRALRPFHVLHRARPLPAADHRLHLPGGRLGRHRPAGRRAGRRLPGDDPAGILALLRRADSRRHGRATRRAQGTADRRRPDPGAAAEAVGRPARTHSARAASTFRGDSHDTVRLLPGRPEATGPADALFKAVDKALAEVVGHKLFTLLYVAPDGKRVKRLYTNMPKEYPVGGYKPVTESDWHKRVIGRAARLGRLRLRRTSNGRSSTTS